MKNNHINNVSLTSVCILGVLSLLGCSEKEVTEEKLRPVKSMVVSVDDSAARERVFSGVARAAEEADLSFKVNGSVIRIPVDVGDILKRGDLIAQLDPATYRLELDQALASTARSNATRRSAESEYQRVRQLYTNDNASQNELDNALADAESAKASHVADVQSARLARLNLDYTQLLVEGDCTVASVDVEVNENVNAGQTVAQVNCGDIWEVQIGVPESVIALFTRGMSGSVSFTSVPGQSFDAAVTEVGVGSSSSNTFSVTLALEQTPANIRSNLAAEVAIAFNQSQIDGSAIYVPAVAVGQDEQGNFVYVLQKSSVSDAAELQRRAVDVGELSVLGLEVKNGLQDGDRILIAGQVNARDGMLVRDK